MNNNAELILPGMIPAGLSCLHFLLPIFPGKILSSMWCSKVWGRKSSPSKSSSSSLSHLGAGHLTKVTLHTGSVTAGQGQAFRLTSRHLGQDRELQCCASQFTMLKCRFPVGRPLSGLGYFSRLTTFHVISLLLVHGTHSEWD